MKRTRVLLAPLAALILIGLIVVTGTAVGPDGESAAGSRAAPTGPGKTAPHCEMGAETSCAMTDKAAGNSCCGG